MRGNQVNVVMFALTVVAAQLIAMPVFVAPYFILAGDYAWWYALLGAVGVWTFLYVLFDRVIAMVWYPSLFFH